ncbi:MAG TPA: hypothetical protein VFI02_13130 [Armatimonadota bacterium]|nr:hypothetical protein [Armatimonadota bacterium]
MKTPPNRQDAQAAADTLGIPLDLDDITIREVTKRFRAIAREVHPDASGNYDLGPALVLSRAIDAKKVLVRWIEATTADPECPLCKGSGFVRSGRLWSSAPCPRCS